MAYFNNTNDANPYFTSSAYEELDPYPALSQTSTGEWADDQANDTFTHGWGMVDQLGPMVDSPTSSRAMVSHEPTASINLYTTQDDVGAQSTYSGDYWPVAGQQAPPYHSSLLNWDGSFTGTLASEASTVIPNSSSVPLDYWGKNQSGPATSTFYVQDVSPPYQPGPSLPRTGVIRTRRFQPYEISHTLPNEHGNAEAGSSALVPLPLPYVGPPTPQPSGGVSEAPANAETNNTTIEEDKVPTTERTRRPRGQGRPRPHRVRTQRVADKLRAWRQQQEGLSAPPTLNDALEVAAEIIPRIRPLVSQQPRLRTMQGKPAATSSRHAKAELERRDEERGFLKDLSRYFPLDQGQNKWTRSSLLSRVLKELEDHSAPPGPSNEPDP